MRRFSSVLLLVGSVLSLLLFVLVTSPPQEHFIVTTIPLVLVWLAVYALMMLVHFVVPTVSLGFIRTFAICVASGSVLLLMFSALGQLGVFDVLLLVALTTLSIFYIRKSWKN